MRCIGKKRSIRKQKRGAHCAGSESLVAQKSSLRGILEASYFGGIKLTMAKSSGIVRQKVVDTLQKLGVSSLKRTSVALLVWSIGRAMYYSTV